jgi:Flp pilus assembly protein TadG
MIARTRVRIGGGSECGSALVELAVVLPLLVLILVAAADFARVFYTANVLTSAARAGAQWGARTSSSYTDASGMQTIALSITNGNLSGTAAAVTPSHTCQCVLDTGAAGSGDCATCTTGHVMIRVTVSVSKTFIGIIPWPGVPSNVPITRSATLRAQ